MAELLMDYSRSSATISCQRCLLVFYCSEECIVLYDQVHEESGHCDELFKRYHQLEWPSQCPPVPFADPNVIDVKEEIQILLTRKFGAVMVAYSSAMGLGRGNSDLHSTHYLHIPLSWTGKRGGNAPWEQFQNNGAVKMVPFVKTEKGRSMVENRLPDSGLDGRVKDCWILFSGSCDGKPFEASFSVSTRLLSASLPLPFDPKWRNTFTDDFNGAYCAFLSIALRRLLDDTEQAKKFCRVWREFFLKLPMEEKMASLFEYRFWFFSGTLKDFPSSSAEAPTDPRRSCQVLPYVPMHELEAYEDNNKLPSPFSIPPLPYSYSPSLFTHPPYGRGFGQYMRARNSRIDPRDRPIPANIIKAAGFNLDMTLRTPRAPQEMPPLPPNPSCADIVAVFRDYYLDSKIRKQDGVMGFFVPAVPGSFEDVFVPMPAGFAEKLAREDKLRAAHGEFAGVQLADGRWLGRN